MTTFQSSDKLWVQLFQFLKYTEKQHKNLAFLFAKCFLALQNVFFPFSYKNLAFFCF